MTAHRVGLVLGGGGLTGTAFHAGVIAALAEFGGWDPRTAELIVGTSAGSTSAALLRAGLPPADFVARMLGEPLSPEGDRVLGGLGPLRPPARLHPRRRSPAAAGLLAPIARRPWRFRPGVLAAALLPEGNLDGADSVAGIGDLFDGWPDRPTWICTVCLEDGERVVFGRESAASMRDAVSASCAIPGYYAPVRIDGRRHVDGGVWSAHNLDLLAGADLDLVVVSAPMSTADPWAIERGAAVRAVVRHRLDHEAGLVRGSGIPVTVVQPDQALREVMGTAMMRLSKRGPVAVATKDHVRDLVHRGDIAGL